MSCAAYDVIVIGAGMTGIAAGYYLGESAIPYTILEAKDELGGVWNTHRWPGARCDSDFIKYSFGFKPFLAEECLQSSATIRRYLNDVAREFSILEHIRFGTRVHKAVFEPQAERWSVHTSQGVFTARFLINGNGYFSDEPYVPHFAGAESFRGELVHTAQLDGRRSFAGKKVVLVGSGSTAICAAPALAETAQSVVLVQRSPSYIYEIDNRAGLLIRGCQSLYRAGLKAAVKWLRHYLQARDDLIFLGFRRFPGLARWIFRRHWLGAVGREAFHRHFNPGYNPWEQRIAVAIGLKEKLRSGAIGMRTAEIERFTESAVVLKGGERLECDVCVLATGLNLRFFSFELHVGEGRVDLARINLHKGLLVGAIPNYFHPMGSWHSAWTQRCEPLIRLAIRVMLHMKAQGLHTVSVPRREVPCRPGITPNYVMRALAGMPRLEGTTDLPTLDNIGTNRFDATRFHFA